MKCSKCNGEMEQGHWSLTAGVWWKKDEPGLLNSLTRVEGNVVMYKCVKCGYLESYVKDEQS